MTQLMALFRLVSIYTNMPPFMIDQMIGATAVDIGAAVQWNFWTFAIGPLTRYFVCLPIPQLQKNLVVFYNPYFSWFISNLNNRLPSCFTHGSTKASEAAIL